MKLKLHKGKGYEYEFYLTMYGKCIPGLHYTTKLTREEKETIAKALKIAVGIVNDELTGKPLNDVAT